MANLKEREFDFRDEDFEYITHLVKEKTGIKLAQHKRNMVYSRLARRLRELKFQAFSDYLDYLSSDDGETEVGNFVNAITTNLTSFFREDHHFRHLKESVQEILATKPLERKMRIWSSASSSGQEPYSIAMTVCDAMQNNLSSWDTKILATDIDTNMLDKCKKGMYPSNMLEDIPEEYRKKYVIGSDSKEEILMADNIKKILTFKQLNLLHEWPMKGPFDFVFCRNVVIYFDKPTQIDLFSRMAELLKPDGILYIGHSESLFKVSDRFELIGRTIYRRIK